MRVSSSVVLVVVVVAGSCLLTPAQAQSGSSSGVTVQGLQNAIECSTADIENFKRSVNRAMRRLLLPIVEIESTAIVNIMNNPRQVDYYTKCAVGKVKRCDNLGTSIRRKYVRRMASLSVLRG